MNETLFSELSAWMTQAGLAGTPETDIVSAFCDRCVAAGIPLGRCHVFIDTLHGLRRPAVPLGLQSRRIRCARIRSHELERPRRAHFRIFGSTSDQYLAARSFLHHAANRRVAAAPPPEYRHDR